MRKRKLTHTPKKIPQKKFTQKEILSFLQYLKEHGDFERPTAEVYYKKAVEQMHINATPQMLQTKAEELKQSYFKVIEFHKTKKIPNKNFAKCIAKKICPYREQLEEIFGANPTNDVDATLAPLMIPFTEIKAEAVHESPNISSVSPSIALNVTPPTSTMSPISSTVIAETPPPSERDESAEPAPKRHKPDSSPTLIDSLENRQLVHCQRTWVPLDNQTPERTAMIKKQLELEERKLRIEEQKLQIENKKIEQNFLINKMQIEKAERIAKQELELKFSYMNQIHKQFFRPE